MQVIIKIPSPLRRFTDNQGQISLDATTVEEAIALLCQQYPQIKTQLVGENEKLRNFVNIYLNKADINQQLGMTTPLKENDELRIVPAIAGGNKALPKLDAAELSRYSRHLMLPEVGIEGQQKLKAAKILIIGAGGLGSPLCLYLTAVGVGSIGIVDHDDVDETNLQRQIIFGVGDVGLNKAERAALRMHELNPNTQIQTYQTILNADNALDIIKDYDLIIDGTDNFPTRYLVNDACVLLNKPNIYGSIFRFEGQASVFNFQNGPCYRCLYPEPPPPGMVPSCAEGGVLGVLPAIIAGIQATEAVKIITGAGKTLSGRLLLYDALLMEFEELTLHKNAQCSLCSSQPSITELIDYQQFCGVPAKREIPQYEEISVQALKQRQDKGERPTILDIREPYEREICQLENSLHIPMQDVSVHLNDFNRDEEIIVHCKSGVRSAQVCDLLLQHGFTKPVNLKGGIMAWAQEVDLHMQKY